MNINVFTLQRCLTVCFMCATLLHNWRVVEWLVEHDANVHLVDNANQTAYMYAQNILSMQTNQPNAVPLHRVMAVLTGSPTFEQHCQKWMAAHHFQSYRDTNMNGQTAAMVASQQGDPALLKMVSQGTDVDVVDNAGMTALMHAVIHQHESVVAFLLDKHADTTIADFGGKTAINHACCATRHKNNCCKATIIDMLILNATRVM